MSAKQPHEYEKQILVAVTGLTPQVVTETLYCLTVKRKLNNEQMFVPTKILLLTTGDGRIDIEEKLLGRAGWLQRFAKHYGTSVGISEETIEEMTEVREIVDTADVRNTKESEAAADRIVNVVRELIVKDKNDESAIVASIAGGRATMGYLLGYALSTFGRDQDRMTHVLVTNKDLEGAKDFFYPWPDRDPVRGTSGGMHNPGPESVELTDIPFVPLRHAKIPKKIFQELLNEKRGYFQTIAATRKLMETDPHLVIQANDPTIVCAGVQVKLSPMEFAIYYYVSARHVDGNPLNITELNQQETLRPGYVAGELLKYYPETTNAQLKEKRRKEIYEEVWGTTGNKADCKELFLNNLHSVRGKIQAAFNGIEEFAYPYFDSPLGKKTKGQVEGESLRPRGLNLSPDAVEIRTEFSERG